MRDTQTYLTKEVDYNMQYHKHKSHNKQLPGINITRTQKKIPVLCVFLFSNYSIWIMYWGIFFYFLTKTYETKIFLTIFFSILNFDMQDLTTFIITSTMYIC